MQSEEWLLTLSDKILGACCLMTAWVGDKDSALAQLEISASIPSGISYGELKLNPDWDPLRGDPRFQKLAGSEAPK